MRRVLRVPNQNRRKIGACLLAGALLVGSSVSPAVAAPSTPTPEPSLNLNPRLAPQQERSTNTPATFRPDLNPHQAPQLQLATPTPAPALNPQLAPHLEQATPPPQANIHNQAGTSLTRKYSTTAGVAAVFEPTANQQLEVFAIDAEGTLKDVWKAQDGPWGRAFSVTGPGFATAGAQPAAVWQPLDQHLEVFGVDDTGTLKVTWKQNDGPWAPAVSLSGPGFAPPGAPVAAVWQPLDEHLEVFVVDGSGAVQDV
jgi:hypothetical protein